MSGLSGLPDDRIVIFVVRLFKNDLAAGSFMPPADIRQLRDLMRYRFKLTCFKKSVRVSKAGCYIKPLLAQYANAVVTSKKHPEIRNRYLRLKKRRGHKKAIIAIAKNQGYKIKSATA